MGMTQFVSDMLIANGYEFIRNSVQIRFYFFFFFLNLHFCISFSLLALRS